MSRLFIELYLDEDVDVLVSDLVRARGFKVTTTQGAGQKGKDDDEQLAYAVSHQLTLFTHNRIDFETRTYKQYRARKQAAEFDTAIAHVSCELGRLLTRAVL